MAYDIYWRNLINQNGFFLIIIIYINLSISQKYILPELPEIKKGLRKGPFDLNCVHSENTHLKSLSII